MRGASRTVAVLLVILAADFVLHLVLDVLQAAAG
jgi:hypothetical protein